MRRPQRTRVVGNSVCRYFVLIGRVRKQGPRIRSGAQDTNELVDLVGSHQLLQAGHLDDGSLQMSTFRDAGSSGCDTAELGALIEACGGQDNILVYGVKELRNTLSSAGYRYWKSIDSHEIYLPSTLQVNAQYLCRYPAETTAAIGMW